MDCGGTYDEEAADQAAETLLSQGISRIDGIILTHYDRDHAGGISHLLSRISCDVLFVPEVKDEEGILLNIQPMMGGGIVSVSQDLEVTYGETVLMIFAPVTEDSGNDSALAVLFRHENCDILITGDRSTTGEWVLLKTANLPELDVLVVGHHGSRYSTGMELLEATRPKIAVISVGRNSYGHPAQETLERLESVGTIVYRTDIHGNITIRR